MIEVLEADDPRWQEMFEHASVAARRCQRRFGRWATFDDLRSAALEYAWRRRDLFEEFLNREGEEEIRRGISAAVKAMERAAERFARKEKAAALGYRVEDEYFYSTTTTEAMILAWSQGDLEAVGQVLDPAEMGGRRSKRPASEGNDLLAMVADIDAAMKSLDPRTYGVVLGRIEGRTTEELATAWEISHQRVSQIYQQGIHRVIDFLGGQKP